MTHQMNASITSHLVPTEESRMAKRDCWILDIVQLDPLHGREDLVGAQEHLDLVVEEGGDDEEGEEGESNDGRPDRCIA